MASLNILRYPDPRLHTVAKPVAQVDDRIRRLVDDMLESMYAADGVGLAATQVDVHERVIVMDTSDARDDPRVLINPELIARSEEMTFAEEGCLSVPLVDDMLESMYAADGVGLAATQVDVHERVIVMDTSDARDDPRVLINPELIARSEEMTFADEGCLSVPLVYDKVKRHARVTVRALDRDGKTQEFEADGLLAICVQHEMDHLMGKVFVEYLSQLKRDRIKTKMLKKAREE
jgi:peptide deformylase